MEVCFESLENFSDIKKLLKEVAELRQQGGVLKLRWPHLETGPSYVDRQNNLHRTFLFVFNQIQIEAKQSGKFEVILENL
ncbi:MAG: hypothetical protein KDD33_04850 [Bdellovibrionales bacterium]|nr:hypothetical protein [Bdellovibrionales bacterium]